MTSDRIRVGLIGANPERGWGLTAHIPALLALPAYELRAVATSRRETAEATARRFGVEHAFADWRDMIERPDLDLITVCVKVPHHREMVMAALAAGKHVFCEWPLGLDTGEATLMLKAAQQAGVHHMVGLQGRMAPALCLARDLVAEGRVGRLLACTLVSSLASWGPRLPPAEAYRTERANGATALTVPGGHTLDCLRFCVGEYRELSAELATGHRRTAIVGTDTTLEVTAPDQVLVGGVLENGAVASVHIKAAVANPTGVRLELNGEDGDLVLESTPPVGPAPVGIQRAELTVKAARGRGADYVDLEVPGHYRRVPEGVPKGPPFFTAQLLARLADAIREGVPAGPDFATAVELHRLLDTVQLAADTGTRQACPGAAAGTR